MLPKVLSQLQRTTFVEDASGNVATRVLLSGGNATVYAVVDSISGDIQNSLATLLAGPNQIGSVTVSHPVTIGAGTNYIGSVTVGHTINSLLQTGSAYIGLATVTQSNQPALVAGAAYIGLASVNIGGTLPALTTGTAWIGFATVSQTNQPALVASSAYIGLASVNIGGTLPALIAGSAYIGLATVTQANQPALVASSAYIGLATTVNATSTAWIGLATVANTDPLLRSGEDQTNDVMKTEQQFSYTALTSVSTIAIKASAGFLHLFNIGMPSCPTIIFYDNTTPNGTVLHRIAAGYPMGSHPMDMKFTTGLSLDAIASGGGVIPQIVVAWR